MFIANQIRRAVDLREHEGGALVWSCAFYFFVLSAYYVLRPIRDEMGYSGGMENLAWLFTGTLLGMLLLHPLYSALVTRMPRRRFIQLTYRIIMLILVAFFLLFRTADAAQDVWIGRVFFVWLSVFNLFVVSVFWSFMADLYRPDQSKRLFGAVAVGGTLGALMGSTLTATLVSMLGTTNMLLVSVVLLELAARVALPLDRAEPELARASGENDGATQAALREARAAEAKVDAGAPPRSHGQEVIGGRVLDGMREVLRSPYLLGIAALMLMYTIVSTFLYFQQLEIVGAAFAEDRAARTRLFANIDLAVNSLTLLTQLFLTGRILRWFGVGLALAFLPLVSLVGFGILATAPILGVVVVFQVLRRTGNFAVQRPAREVLYTVLARSEKYKAKNFNDTFVYRVGDQVGAWSYTAMSWFGFGLSALAFTMVPLSAVWLLLALWLGRKHVMIRRERQERSRVLV